MCVKIWVLLCKIKKEISGERIEGTEVLVMKRHERGEVQTEPAGSSMYIPLTLVMCQEVLGYIFSCVNLKLQKIWLVSLKD